VPTDNFPISSQVDANEAYDRVALDLRRMLAS